MLTPTTGSYFGKPMFDAKGVITKAWNQALAQVPKPEAARLDDRTLELPLDVAMSIEGAGTSNTAAKLPGIAEGVLMPGEIHGTTTATH
jgi:hypothetical protein